MTILFSVGGFMEIAVFLLAATAFVMAVRFFMDSRKRLNTLFPGLIGSRRAIPFSIDRNGFLVPKRAVQQTAPVTAPSGHLSKKTSADGTKEAIYELRLQLQQQQQDLAAALRKLALANGQTTASANRTATPVHEQLAELQSKLKAKEAEIQRLRQQEAYAQKLQEQFAHVQDAFDEMQEKMMLMEQQAWHAADLNLQLEQALQAEQKLETDLYKKEEKLRTLLAENGQLRDTCHELETKLAESLRQQQQLVRKMHLLEGLNTDMLQMTEASRKLKSGMARAAELESLLQSISPLSSGKSGEV